MNKNEKPNDDVRKERRRWVLEQESEKCRADPGNNVDRAAIIDWKLKHLLTG